MELAPVHAALIAAPLWWLSLDRDDPLSPICGTQAGKAAFARKRRCLSFFQCWLNLGEPHSPAAFRAGQAGHRRVRRLGRYQNAKPLLCFLVQNRNALAQFVASRQHHPATLQIEVFCFFDLIGGISRPRPALRRAFVALRDLSRGFPKHRPHLVQPHIPLN